MSPSRVVIAGWRHTANAFGAQRMLCLRIDRVMMMAVIVAMMMIVIMVMMALRIGDR